MSTTDRSEREELYQAVAAFLRERSPETGADEETASGLGYEPSVWKQLAGEIGAQAIAVPEEYGGAGGGYSELGVVARAMGASLYSGPFFSTAVLAVVALQESDDIAAKAELLPAIASGSMVVALAADPRTARPNSSFTATSTDQGWRVNGTVEFVLDGLAAQQFVVPAWTPDGVATFVVAADEAGIARRGVHGLDLTRRAATVTFTEVTAKPLTCADPAIHLDNVRSVSTAVLAAEQVGTARRALEMAVDHAKQRHQFGRPIGSFQAIKHKCAAMLLAVDSAQAMSEHALDLADRRSARFPLMASMAKAHCSVAALDVVSDCVQIHGGIGFTWEHPAHLFFKRAKVTHELLGSPARHRADIAQILGIAPDHTASLERTP